MKNRLLQWVKLSSARGKLRNKLLFIYFVLIVLPLGLFTLYAYLRVRSVVQKQTFSAAQNAFDDTVMSVQQAFGRLDKVLDILTIDPLVYSMSSNDPLDYTYIRRLEDSNQFALTLEHLRVLSDIERIRLYVNNDYLYANTQSNILQVSQIRDSAWYDTTTQQSTRIWLAPVDFTDQSAAEQGWFSSVQVIYNPRSVKEPLAILRADADAQRIAQLVGGTSITENGLLLVLRDNEVLLCSGTAAPQELTSLVSQLPAADLGSWQLMEIHGKRYYAQCSALANPGWRMASLLPYNDVFRLSNELRTEMLVTVALVGAVAYLLAYAISKATLKRLALLTQTMQAVEQGNVAARLEPIGNDEIAQLMGGFSRMMDRVDGLMEEKLEQGRQIKNLELKALQAQINPHFLYNSLDLINCTAITHNVPQISRMVHALSRFYKLSLSRGREVIPLADETKHAQLYVELQNMRFDNRVQVEWVLDENAAHCQIIKIVLQPLIENAIIHGIFETPSKSGHLRVCTHREGSAIRILIEDDGAGMDEATRLANFSPTPLGGIAQTTGGYGVRNIHDRLRLAYGEAFGLFCESTPGEGTRVTVLIPAVEPPKQT